MHHLRAAKGWLDLGNLNESRSELELISTPQYNHPEVMEIRWNLSAKEKNWQNCVKIAQLLVESATEQPAGWIHRSFALHELNQTEEAYIQLKPAQNLFKILAKNLEGGVVLTGGAGYLCQMRTNETKISQRRDYTRHVLRYFVLLVAYKLLDVVL